MRIYFVKSLVVASLFLLSLSPVEAWKETHTIQGQTFEIDFPREPERDSPDRDHPIESFMGALSLEVEETSDEFSDDINYEYSLNLITFPVSFKIDAPLFLQQLLESAMKKKEGYLLTDGKIYSREGMTILDLTIFEERRKKTISSRIILKENHLYVLALKDNRKDSDPLPFFNSFKILETPKSKN